MHRIDLSHFIKSIALGILLLLVLSSEISAQTTQSVTSFTLINTVTDQPVAGYDPILSGATINLSQHPSITIRANTSPITVGSVRWGLGSNSSYAVDSTSPYVINPSISGNYTSWTAPSGTQTITATPYTSSGAIGTAGTQRSISITFTTGATASPIPTSQPTGSTESADINRDSNVNVQDLLLVIKNWFSTGLCSAFQCDVLQDGLVNSFDFLVVVRRINQPSTPTPTPAVSLPTPTPFATPTPGGSLGKLVDTTDTDFYVNSFIKKQITAGDRRVVATGTWWGPTNKFFQNQLWSVVRNVQPGVIYTPGQRNISTTFTCLLPGKLPGKGSVKNTLSFPNMLFNFGNQAPHVISANSTGSNTLETFQTLFRNGNPDGSIEFRTRCQAFETSNNPFDEASPIGTAGDEVRNNYNHMVWFGDYVQEPESDQTKTANHLLLPTTRKDIMDAHSWYDNDVEYDYAIPENAPDLLGKTVKGTITVRGWAIACRLPNCPHTDSTPINIHHHAIKVEQNNKDYWYFEYATSPESSPLPSNLRQNNLVSFPIDTTRMTDGWHIISYHVHVIDKRNVPGFFGKQLASEFKFPICVENVNTSACP